VTYSLTDSLAHSLTDSLAHSLTDSLVHSLTDSLAHSLTDSLVHSLTDSLVDSLTHSLALSLTGQEYPDLYSAARGTDDEEGVGRIWLRAGRSFHVQTGSFTWKLLRFRIPVCVISTVGVAMLAST
ncbi:hypothetical protein T484DRAFT_1629966, partial [Baffinella frigidus]